MNTLTLDRRLTGISLVMLMVASTFAAAPSGTELREMMSAANLGVPGAYSTVQNTADKLHNVALAMREFANRALADGTTARLMEIAIRNKAKFLGPIDEGRLYEQWKDAREHGYRGGYDDFSRRIRSYTEDYKREALEHVQRVGVYRAMVDAADGFEEASRAVRNGLVVNPIRPICFGIAWGLAFLGIVALVAGSAASGGILTGPFLAGAGIVWGIASQFVC